MTGCFYSATKRQFDDTVAIHPTSAEGMCYSLDNVCLTIGPHNCCFRIGHIKVDEALGYASENVH